MGYWGKCCILTAPGVSQSAVNALYLDSVVSSTEDDLMTLRRARPVTQSLSEEREAYVSCEMERKRLLQDSILLANRPPGSSKVARHLSLHRLQLEILQRFRFPLPMELCD